MSANEIVTVTRQYRQRIVDLLTPDEVADYDAYEQRVQAQIDARNAQPIETTPAEDMVLAKIAADERAAVLHKQLMVLLRIEKLPQ